jgi:sigma-B regulation protein RsbU (phosphoserine phosphatase)
MKTAAFIEFVAVAIIAFEAIVLMEVLELGKTLAETASQKAWPIDKFITVPMIVALAITFYAQNRLKEHTIELQKAKKIVETAKNVMSEELRLAGIVQQDFLPEQMPNCDKLRWATFLLPAECVSGDIYDVKRIDEQYVGFYVADVVGHGMPAALLSIFIKQAIDVYEDTQNNHCVLSPAELMKYVNLRISARKFSDFQFITCCYCLININTLQLTYCRAGHPYPILIRGQEPPQNLEIDGTLLGIFGEAEYSQRTIQLQPGDKLLLYSDGAIPFISNSNDVVSLNFREEFREIIGNPIVEMMDKFSALAENENKEIDPSEIDDVTAIGFEVL